MENARPAIKDLEQFMSSWTVDELQAFFTCVRDNQSSPVPSSRQELVSQSITELFWTHNSKARAKAGETSAKAKETAYKQFQRWLPQPTPVKPLHEYVAVLNYEVLLRGCCKKLKIERSETEDLSVLEIYLFEKVMISAVAAMTAEQRHMFLIRPVVLDGLAMSFPNAGIKGATTTLAALGAAQASGLGVYLGATTALGFVSHAIGVTLPFAVYVGMSSTIAFLIGPLGFLAAGAWLGWSITGPEWNRILRGVLHIIAMRAKYEYNSKRLLAPNTPPDELSRAS